MRISIVLDNIYSMFVVFLGSWINLLTNAKNLYEMGRVVPRMDFWVSALLLLVELISIGLQENVI